MLSDDCIKLSVQETDESTVWLRSTDAFEDCPEEASESINSHDGQLKRIQTNPMRFFSNDLHEEPSESIRSSVVGLQRFRSFLDLHEEPSESIRSSVAGLQRLKSFLVITPKRVIDIFEDKSEALIKRPFKSAFLLFSEITPKRVIDIFEDKSEALIKRPFKLEITPKRVIDIFEDKSEALIKRPFQFVAFSAQKFLTEIWKGYTTLYLSRESHYGKDHPKKPTSRPLLIPSYMDGAIQSSILSFRNLQLSTGFSAFLLLKVLFTSLFQIAVSETQSLRYYHTGVFYQDERSFTFHAVGFVNNHQIDKYDHMTKRDVPVASWIEKHEDTSYWDRETSYRRGWEKVFSDNLRILKYRLNGSSIFLTLQLMYGCDLGADGNIRGYYQYALNGRDFLYLDDISMMWQPVVNEAQISAKRWNTDPHIAESVKDYLTLQCTSALKRYVMIGEQELNKTVRPEVKVWGRRQSYDVMRLQCLVYGFHPRAVDVKWVRNGVDDVPSDEMSPILPHPDGTYQIRVSAEVPIREGDTFSCHVDHSSLGSETLSVKWETNNYNTLVRATLQLASAIYVLILISIIKLLQARRSFPKSYIECSVINRPPM